MFTSRTIFQIILVLLSTFIVQSAHAQVRLVRVQSAPNLADYRPGKSLPNEVGAVIQDFTQNSPKDGTAPSHKTTAYLSYDEHNLYAVFVANANPNYLIARHTRRESNGGEDYVMLQIDTFQDQQRAYVFYANPLGVQADSRFIEGKEEDFDFDTQWQTEGELTSTGYLVKFTIPFKSLRFPANDIQNWGLSVARYIPELSEFDVWPHITRQKSSNIVSQFGKVVIPDRLAAQNPIQFNPYLAVSKNKLLQDPLRKAARKDFFRESNKAQVGFDSKYVLNNAFTFDLTVKPDFSEVESDEPQVLVDKRFEVLFPEKRPLFIENKGFFETPLPLFFSRRVVEPEGGLRITGREGEFALGALLINDIADGKQHRANISMLRTQIDSSKGSNLGMLIVNKEQDAARNLVAGLDFRYAWDANWTLNGQVAGSQTNSQSKQDGKLIYVDAGYANLSTKYLGKFSMIDRDFDASLGFIPRLGIRQSDQTASYTWFSEANDWTLSKNLQLNWVYTQRQDAQFSDKKIDALLTVKAKQANTLQFQLLTQTERLAGRDVSTQGWKATWTSKTLPQLTSTIAYGEKRAANYGYTRPEVLSGDATNAQLKLLWTPGQHWSFEQTVFLTTLKHRLGEIYQDRIMRSNLGYQFDNAWGFNAIFDYHSLRSNPALNRWRSNKALNTNLQLRYVLSPGTSFYLTYIDRQEGLQLIADQDGLYQTRASDKLDLHTGRSLSMKLSYLF
ncbi:MAG: hypothetical protein E6Q34_11200 [Burkholderiaceae bacterium]|nr:MAG: hypothetical protein E6Q34_11200 [Burkholderiaceae bacterium]